MCVFCSITVVVTMQGERSPPWTKANRMLSRLKDMLMVHMSRRQDTFQVPLPDTIPSLFQAPDHRDLSNPRNRGREFPRATTVATPRRPPPTFSARTAVR